MAIHKVIGTETEYGIVIRNQADFNPALASGLVVGSYRAGSRVQWSIEEESPGRDARGFAVETGYGDLDSGVVNLVLTNGARLYVDHAHPEYSAPESYSPRQAALYDKAGEIVMHRAAVASSELLQPQERVGIYKNNSDGKGNSYGAHENYLVARDLPFGEIVRHFSTFLVTRQILSGSGKVGSENGRPGTDYQITQRADFVEEEVGLETTLKRPIINTRDEPHGDPDKYRRLHVIIGDANLSEVQMLVKLGSAAVILAAIEDGALPHHIALADPVESCWRVSHDPELEGVLELADGTTATVLELQFQYLDWAKKYAETADVGEVYRDVLEHWERLLVDLERDVDLAADRLDWVAKRRLLAGLSDRHGVDWDSSKLRAASLQYHDVDPERSLYQRLVNRGSLQRIFTDDEIDNAVGNPPPQTRAWFRGECIRRFGAEVVAANWDSLIFDTGQESLRRVPMMEPLRGGEALVGPLFERADSAAELLEALGGSDG